MTKVKSGMSGIGSFISSFIIGDDQSECESSIKLDDISNQYDEYSNDDEESKADHRLDFKIPGDGENLESNIQSLNFEKMIESTPP